MKKFVDFRFVILDIGYYSYFISERINIPTRCLYYKSKVPMSQDQPQLILDTVKI